ncbi:hypothetical protein QEN19_001393 [Hanseniaspora menglaensis]
MSSIFIETKAANTVQTLEIQDTADDIEKQKLIKIGIQCATPGLPKTLMDEETQQQLENVFNCQNAIIRDRHKRKLQDVVQWNKENDEDDDDEKEEAEMSEDEESLLAGSSEHCKIKQEAYSKHKLKFLKTSAEINVLKTKNLKRPNLPSLLNLPIVNTSKNIGDKENISSYETKPKSIINYLSYNQNLNSSYGQISPSYSQTVFLNQQQLAVHNQMLAQRQLYPYSQTLPTVMGHLPMNNFTNGQFYANPLFYNQEQHAVVTADTRINSSMQKIELPIKDKLSGSQVFIQTGELQLTTSNVLSATIEKDHSIANQPSGNETYCSGLIKISNDNFPFEFQVSQTLNSEDENKQRFMKICEKTWKEANRLTKKRLYCTNSTIENSDENRNDASDKDIKETLNESVNEQSIRNSKDYNLRSLESEKETESLQDSKKT